MEEPTEIIMHVLHGLIDVHKEGIVHRDIAAGIAIFIASSAGVFDRTIHQEEEITVAANECNVPMITDLTVDEVKKRLGKENLELTITEIMYSDEIAVDHILKQSPESGSVVANNTMIRVAISGGTEKSIVPDIRQWGFNKK